MQAIAGTLIMALSAALLWHMSNIWRYGTHLIQEQNKVILINEIALLVVIFAFGMFLFIGKRRNHVKN